MYVCQTAYSIVIEEGTKHIIIITEKKGWLNLKSCNAQQFQFSYWLNKLDEKTTQKFVVFFLFLVFQYLPSS